MLSTRLLISLFELTLMIASSGLLIVLIYRLFIRANPDFDMEESIRQGNIAVGILMASILICAAQMLARGLEASISVFRLAMSAPGDRINQILQAVALITGHMVLTLAIAVVTISVALRLFGRLAMHINPQMRLGELLEAGNVAVGLLLAAVVFIATLFVGEGVSAVTKALVPQPDIGTIQIMR